LPSTAQPSLRDGVRGDRPRSVELVVPCTMLLRYCLVPDLSFLPQSL
jgi:hypothetical protein